MRTPDEDASVTTAQTSGEFGYVVSLRLAGRRAVVVGNGELAAARARDLSEAGADVAVFATQPTAALQALAASVRLHERPYRRGDLAGAAVAIATREQPFDLDGFWTESRAVGALASVLDDPDHLDFATPAQVRRGDLRLTVSTGGTAPALAKRLRERLDETLGPEWADLVAALGQARADAGPRDVPFEEWSQRWSEALADLPALASLAAAGDLDAIVKQVVERLTAARADYPPCASARPGAVA